MSFTAESRRNKFFFGTENRAEFFPTPNRGAPVSPEGWTDGGTLLNGGGYQQNSFGSHKTYMFEWPESSSREVAQKMKSYADGSYGRGLIYFLDPLTWTTNMLPAQWAAPSMGLGYEGASLVYGVDPVSVPTSGWEQNDLPVNSAYYDLAGVSSGWRGKEEAVFIPIPDGYTLSLGSFHSQSGNGRVFYREQAKNGALGAITALTPLANNASSVLNTFISGSSSVAGVWLYVGKTASGAGSVTLTAMIGRLIQTDKVQLSPVATNLVTDPGCVTGGDPWGALGLGIGGSNSLASVTHVTAPWAYSGKAMRVTAGASANAGHCQGSSVQSPLILGAPGTKVFAVISVYSPIPRTMRIRVRPLDSGGGNAGDQFGGDISVPANTKTTVFGLVTLPASTVRYTVTALQVGGTFTPGDWCEFSEGGVEHGTEIGFFSGSSGSIVVGGQTLRTQWDGTPNDSTSSAWVPTPQFDALKEGPWIGGQGHSGCRFMGKPTYINNTGVDGGQVGFAASFREVGLWING